MSKRFACAACFAVAIYPGLALMAPAAAQVDQQLAGRYFSEVAALCERDGGRLWGMSLCGPMVFADAQRLSNADLAPTRVEQRTWTTYHIASLWIGLSVCIPTYLLAAGLVQGGMSWKQAIFTILLGNVIVAVPMVLIAHSGTRFGIPFPVLARASFGTAGAHVPAILRSLVACGWFGIQTWIGGQAIQV